MIPEEEEDEEEEDQGLELLDMLCDGVEAEQQKDKRKEELEEMNKQMDRRLNTLRMKKINKHN